ncbi:DEAD/DEAH box helicase [Escherichia coli]
MTEQQKLTFADLQQRLDSLMLRDRQRFSRRLHGVKKVKNPDAQQAIFQEMAKEIDQAAGKVLLREAARPEITYPDNLPVSQKKQDILEAINCDHQVVIVAGETGSGKTTQLPKICMELGRGIKGLIGHTQPRRLAARTVANRIAEELKTEPGGCIGYKVRFSDHVSDNTMVKLMTDGILLAEIQQDRLLMQYDTIIIDEAHERSLNIDFLLGYLKELLPRRPDLKIIITSATIDPERFSRHFNNAPIILELLSGRTYPVEVRYRPIVEEADDTERDQLQAIFDAVNELTRKAPATF